MSERRYPLVFEDGPGRLTPAVALVVTEGGAALECQRPDGTLALRLALRDDAGPDDRLACEAGTTTGFLDRLAGIVLYTADGRALLLAAQHPSGDPEANRELAWAGELADPAVRACLPGAVLLDRDGSVVVRHR